jgi:hypothetical protein
MIATNLAAAGDSAASYGPLERAAALYETLDPESTELPEMRIRLDLFRAQGAGGGAGMEGAPQEESQREAAGPRKAAAESPKVDGGEHPVRPSQVSRTGKPRLFLSYRRDDCPVHAHFLNVALQLRMDADVFFDTDSIPLGRDFVKEIETEVSACDAVIVMIGDSWLTLTDEKGRRRISSPNDWVRAEVKAALDRDIPVVPVLVQDTPMPEAKDLPRPIRRLTSRNAARLGDDSLPEDASHLVERLRATLSGGRI